LDKSDDIPKQTTRYEYGETVKIDGFDKTLLPFCKCGCQQPVQAMTLDNDNEDECPVEYLIKQFARPECSKAARPARPKAEVGRSYPQKGFTLSYRPPACSVCSEDCEVVLNDRTEMQSFKSTCGKSECLATQAKVRNGENEYFDGRGEQQDAAEMETSYVG
jgi:hypothetical protein